MSPTLDLVRTAVAAGQVRVSQHAIGELNEDAIALDDIVDSVPTAIPVEDYASAWKGPSVLALHCAAYGRALHVAWGLARGATTPAVLVKAYGPDPGRWTADFTRTRR